MLKRDIYAEEKENGMSVTEIAEKYGVSRSSVYNAVAVREGRRDLGELNEETIHKDCIMFRSLEDGRRFCSGLNGLFCGVEKCNFYKPKEAQKK